MALVDIATTPDAQRFTLDVSPRVCVGPPGQQFLFGGAALAAAIAALQAATGRPAVWAAAQYLSYARPPAVLDLDVIVPVSGKYNSQARVTGHVGATEILTVNAAMGARPAELSMQWAVAPVVAPPGDCPPMLHNWSRGGDDIHEAIELRTAKGRFGADRIAGEASPDGQAVLWVRPRDPACPIDAVALAVFADFLPSGIGNATGRHAGGNSLDNTIRFARLVPTEWVLCDIRVHAIDSGFGHGRMHLFAQDGTLLATASQSLIIRLQD